jgi:hypothetical protein
MQSFPLISGEDVILDITVRDNDDAIVNLTGGTVRFAAARTPTGTPVIDSAASPATATAVVQDGPNGLVRVTITDTNTDPLSGDYYYEIKVTDVGGLEAVVTRGWMSFADNLT